MRPISNPRVLCICLDSADWDLLLRWAGRGDLPNLQRLLAGAAWSTTLPQSGGFFVGPVWPSFNTGQGPETHGKFAERQLLPGTYRILKAPLSASGGTPFRVRLGGRGRISGAGRLPGDRRGHRRPPP